MTRTAGFVWGWTLLWLLMAFELGCSQRPMMEVSPDTTPPVSWPAAVSQHVEVALDASRQSWSVAVRDREAWERLRVRFDSELDGLAAMADERLFEQARVREGEEATAKLIMIASYRRSHEERIRNIAERFHFDGPPNDWRPGNWHAPPPTHDVTEAWAGADDRLAWEYLLLRPSPRRGPSTQFVWVRIF